MGNIGFKGSKDTKSTSSTDTRDFTFTSSNKSLKLWTKGSATVGNLLVATPFNYPPTFAAYTVQSAKYFVNYSSPPAFGNSFEYTGNYVSLSIDDAYFFAGEGSTIPTISYLIFADPLISVTTANSATSSGSWGIKIVESGAEALTAKDYQAVLSSKFQTPLIVQSGTLSVTTPEITIACDLATDTSTVNDVAHTLGSASHLVISSTDLTSNFTNDPRNLSPGPPPYVWPDVEIYVDSTKIRLRVSRHATGNVCIINPANKTFPAATFSINYYLTNIALA